MRSFYRATLLEAGRSRDREANVLFTGILSTNIDRIKNKTNANDPSLDVDSLNDFFINVSKVVTLDLPDTGVKFIEYLHNIDVSSMHSFAFKHVSYIQVRDALKALHNKKSRDYYGLTADVN